MTEEKNLSLYFCKRPFNNIEIHLNGEVFVCCPSWLPESIGSLEHQTVGEIWNSPKAQMIRESVIDGSFRFCNKELCPYIQSTTLPLASRLEPKYQTILKEGVTVVDKFPENVMLDYDLSCNLSCPSCRTQKIMASSESDSFIKAQALTDKIQNQMIQDLGDGHMTLNVTGSGDPFASSVFRKFLENIDGSRYPNLKIDFQTNGLLLNEKMWSRLTGIHSNINRIMVSIDAAKSTTYSIVRRDGVWQNLLENMNFLVQLRRQKRFSLLQARFVVQKNNYAEMTQFSKLFLKSGVDSIEFSLLSDWGTWSKDKFAEQCVWRIDHPEHHQFLECLADPILNHQRVFLGNVQPFQKKVSAIYAKNIFYKTSLMRQKIQNFFIRFKINVSKFLWGP